MVKKRIVIFSLVLLCSSVVRADTKDANESDLSAGLNGNSSSSLQKDPSAALQGLQDGAKSGSAESLQPVADLAGDALFSSVVKEPLVPSPVDPEMELRNAGLSRIAVLENALNHLAGSLSSEFLSADAQAKIKQEIETHKKLIGLEIDALAAKVTNVLKAKAVFASQDVLKVIAECRDLQNRSDIVDRALKNIFAEIAELNVQAGQVTTPAERAELSSQRAILEKTEADFAAAKNGVVNAVCSDAQASDVKLFRLMSASSTSARTIVETFAVVGVGAAVALAGKGLGFWKL